MNKKKLDIGKYKYNDSGVCTNPDEVVRYESKAISYKLHVAECHAGWLYGFDLRQLEPELFAISCGVSITGGIHPTKAIAIQAAAEYALGWFADFGKDLDPLKELITSSSVPDETPNNEATTQSLNKTITMTKTIATIPAAPGPSSLNMVGVHLIIPSPTNKIHREEWELKEETDPTFKDIVESVRQRGVIQPVLLRPAEKGKYYLVCGERRFTASKIASIKEIPAYIQHLNDDEAFESQIIENLQRKDVHPLKEAESYKVYMEQKNASIDDLVAKFSKTKDYIMQRLSFNNLIPEMKKDFYTGKMGPGQAALFSRLTWADQNICLQQCRSSAIYEPIDEIKDFISSNVMRQLTKVPFSLTDEKLVPAAGSCAACPKRSGAGLFGDIKEKDRCFDGVCFKNKTDTYVLSLVEDLLNNHPDTPVVKFSRNDSAKGDIKKALDKAKRPSLVQYHDFDRCTKTDKGAIRALCVAGPSAGHFVYVKIKKKPAQYNSSPSAAGPGSAATPPKVPLQKKIQEAENVINEIKGNIQDELSNLLETKLVDFKPYKSPDSKPLTKYEQAALYLVMEDNCGLNGVLKAAMDKIKVPGASASHPAFRVEQYASIPADLLNFFLRNYLTDLFSYNSSDETGYLLLKMAEENTAIKIPELQAIAAKKFEKQLAAAEKKLQELKSETTTTKKAATKK